MAKGMNVQVKVLKSKKKGNAKGIKGKGPKVKDTKPSRGQGQYQDQVQLYYNLSPDYQIVK